MKRIYLSVLLVISILSTNAQESFPLGKTQFNTGVGFSKWGVPVYFGLDYTLQRDITIGAEIDYSYYNENLHNYYYGHNITSFSGNMNYHFNTVFSIPKDFDLYGGFNIGFYSWTSPVGYNGVYSSGLGIGGQIGARYYLTRKFGLNMEFGGGNEFVGGKFGLTIRL